MNAPVPPLDAIRLAYGDDRHQFGDLRLPVGAGPHPVVVVVHGGFWRAIYDLEYMEPLCAALTAAGMATWSLEYRRVGHQGGGWPGTFHDVARGADALRHLAQTYPLDLTRVATLGHSAGGHLALWLAARPRIPTGDPLRVDAPLAVRGAVSLAGVADLRHAWSLGLGQGIVETFLGGTPATVPERYATASPAALLPLGLPQILIHGTEDAPVPYVVSHDYHAAARAVGDDCTLVTLDGLGHFELTDPASAAWPAVLEAARRFCAAP